MSKEKIVSKPVKICDLDFVTHCYGKPCPESEEGCVWWKVGWCKPAKDEDV